MVSETPRGGRLRRHIVATGLIVTCALVGAPATAAVASPASPAPHPAAPAAPASPDETKQAWLDAGRQYAALGEQVLVSQQKVADAQAAYDAADKVVQSRQAAYDAAKAVVDTAQRSLDEAEAKVRAAEASVVDFRKKLDEIANASIRTAATSSSLASFLSAKSPEEYIGAANVQQILAQDVTESLVKARKLRDDANQLRTVAEQARTAAEQAGADAISAHQAAQRAVDEAQKSKTAAQQAQAEFDRQQQELAGKMEVYQRAYALLTDADRSAAITAQEAFNEANNAAAAASRTRDGQTVDPASMSMADLAAAASRIAPNVEAGIAVTAALSRVGLPYVWGANGPDTFDCSSLMQWSWAQTGVSIPRTSAAQAGLRPIGLSDLQPGDLVTYYQPVTHVGMYIGFGLVVHASQPGVPVKVVPLDKAGPQPWGHAVNR